jgi:hypothetical protein
MRTCQSALLLFVASPVALAHTGLHHDLGRRPVDLLLEPYTRQSTAVLSSGASCAHAPAHDIFGVYSCVQLFLGCVIQCALRERERDRVQDLVEGVNVHQRELWNVSGVGCNCL